jgi:hypothetical protein
VPLAKGTGGRVELRRPPSISKGQINKGLCGYRGCGRPVTNKRHLLKIRGERIPVCRDHFENAHESLKIGGTKERK